MLKDTHDTATQITIGLPFFNNEDTLQNALKSILKQSIKNWKLILINDGSTDNSHHTIGDAILQDPRVTYIDDSTNRGLVFRLNQIADLCTTPFLVRMDADDMMVPERIETQLNYLLENPDVDLVDSALYSVDGDLQVVGIRGMEPLRYSAREIVLKSMLNHATITGKTNWFKRNKYNPDFLRAEDYELWCRTFSFSNFRRIEKPLYIVREGRVNVKNYERSMNTCRKILRLYGPSHLTGKELQIEVVKTYLKAIVYRVMGLLGWQDVLTKHRNHVLDEQERIHINLLIEDITRD